MHNFVKTPSKQENMSVSNVWNFIHTIKCKRLNIDQVNLESMCLINADINNIYLHYYKCKYSENGEFDTVVFPVGKESLNVLTLGWID